MVWRTAAGFWHSISAVLATLVLALWMAVLVARPPPDFSALRPVAVVKDEAQRPAWTVRLAPAAHEIAADAVHPQLLAAGQAYQLWLAVPAEATPRPLGLLPQKGRKVIPVTPENTRLLAGKGELLVSLEAAGGSRRPGPSGPLKFHGPLNGS